MSLENNEGYVSMIPIIWNHNNCYMIVTFVKHDVICMESFCEEILVLNAFIQTQGNTKEIISLEDTGDANSVLNGSLATSSVARNLSLIA